MIRPGAFRRRGPKHAVTPACAAAANTVRWSAACLIVVAMAGSPRRAVAKPTCRQAVQSASYASVDRRTAELIAQGDDDSGEPEVSAHEVEQYVAVYKAMQRDRTLTIDQAAPQQGLSLQTFRELESRVQRDDAALERAREELQAAAAVTPPAASPSPTAAAP